MPAPVIGLRRIMLVCAGVGALLPLGTGAGTTPLDYQKQTLNLDRTAVTVTVPAGYMLEILSKDLDRPRLLSFAGNGDLLVGSHSKVYRLPPPYTRPQVLVEPGDYPHSVALRDSEILIAQTGGLYRAPYRPGQATLSERDLTQIAPLPAGGGHSSRSVVVGPDGQVYVGLGLSGNCSDEYLGPSYPFPRWRGGVLVLREEGGKARWEPYATGLRNPIGLAWQPDTGVLYAANNGPDHWGYELPPEYFSRLTPGSFHGMPWFQYDGRQLRRDTCAGREPPRPQGEVVKPVATFPARSAPMGVAFVPKGAMDERLTGDAVVALHGSWATRPTGGAFGNPATRRAPELVVVRFENGEAKRVDGLVTGFQLQDGERWARPVGVAIGPDGALYFTSDSGVTGLFRLRRAP